VGPDNGFFVSDNGVLFDINSTKLIRYPSNKKGLNYVVPKSVLSIETGAFAGCQNLKNLEIPNNVSTIGSSAFSFSRSLESVTLPSNIGSINYYQFEGCENLSSISIPESVTSINSRAFSGCISLSSITIPSKVKSIGSDAFNNCTSLLSVEVDEGNEAYQLVDGAVFSDYRSSLVLYPSGRKSAVIPNNTVVIQPYSLSGCKQVVIPEFVRDINSNAFSACPDLSVVRYLGTINPGGSVKNFDVSRIFVSSDYRSKFFCDSANFEKGIPYIVSVSGVMDKMFVVANDSSLSSLKELLPYMEDEENYVVGDSEDNNVLTGDVVVTRDMNIVVMQVHSVVIVVEAGLTEVNFTEVAIAVSELCGIDPRNIIVQTVTGESGEIISIMLYFEVEDNAIVAVEKINDLDKGDSCTSGVLCRSKKAFLNIDVSSIEASNRCFPILSVAFLMLLMTFIVVKY